MTTTTVPSGYKTELHMRSKSRPGTYWASSKPRTLHSFRWMTRACQPSATKFMNSYPRRKHGPGKKTKKDAILGPRKNTGPSTSTPCSDTKLPSAWTNMIWAWPKTSHTKSTLKIMNQFNLPKQHNKFIEQTLDNLVWFGKPAQPTLHQSFPYPRNKDKDKELFWTSGNSICFPTLTSIPWRKSTNALATLEGPTPPYFLRWIWPQDSVKTGRTMKLLTAFTIPGQCHFHWITSPMRLLGCQACFQWLMEQVLRGLQNVLIYIDEVLIHTDTHEKLLEALGQVLLSLHLNQLKIILDKYLHFGGQSSVLPRIHTHSSMSQTRESQALGHWRCRHLFIRGLVQLLSKPHSQLRDHSSTIIPTHPPRVWIYFRSANGFRNPP